mgnify:CR=1 FL=1
MSVSRWNRTQLQGKRVYWLLDLDFAGETLRSSTQALDVNSDAGPLHYHPGLEEIVYGRVLDVLGQGEEPASVPLEVLLPVDVPARVAAGHDLSSSTASLSRWIEGTAWEDRKVVLIGAVVDPAYGEEGVPTRFSLEAWLLEDTALVPEASAVVSKLTTNTTYLAEDDLEIPYPLIYGHPGQVRSEERVTGSIACWRSKNTYHHSVVLAGHRVQCAFVRANTDENTSTSVFQVNHVEDYLGREIAIIDAATDEPAGTTPIEGVAFYPGLDSAGVPASFQPGVDDSSPIFISWEDPDGLSLGGMQGLSGDLIRGAGDVMIDLLRRSRRQVDLGRLHAVKERLNGFNLDFSLSARAQSWEFVRDTLLPLLPVSVATGAKGIYLVVFDYGATAQDAVATIDADQNPHIAVSERVSYDSSRIANLLSISYAFSTRVGTYTKRLVMGARGVESHATGDIICYGNDRIRVIATTKGKGGDGIVVSVVSGAFAPIEDAAAKTVTLSFQSGVTTPEDMVDAINGLLGTVRAYMMSGTGTMFMSAGDVGTSPTATEQTVTLLERDANGVDLPSHHCTVSQGRFRGRVNEAGTIAKDIESRLVYEPATAAMVLAWQARAFSLPWLRVSVALPEADYADLQEGNVVLFTRARLGLNNRVAHVEALEEGDDGLLAATLFLLQESTTPGG